MTADSAQYVSHAMFASLGGLTAMAFYGALWLNTRFYLNNSTLLWPFVLHVSRFGGLAVFFWWTANEGAGPLIAAFVGHMAVRHIALRVAQSGAE
jgi:hypothetical protein